MKLIQCVKRLRWTVLWPVLEASLGVWPGIFLILVSVQILLHSRQLGWFFVPVVLLYIGSLIAGFAYTQFAKSRRDLRGVIGDELFFQLYPKEKRRWERMRAREIVKAAKRHRKESVCL